MNLSETSDGRNLIQQFGWHIVIILCALYYLNENLIKIQYKKWRQSKSLNEAKDPERVSTLNDHMAKVREKQQEQAQKKSEEAAKIRKQKQVERMKEMAVKKENTTNGRKLGGSKSKPSRVTPSSSYNPLMPGASTGSSYRPARRQVNRGG